MCGWSKYVWRESDADGVLCSPSVSEPNDTWCSMAEAREFICLYLGGMCALLHTVCGPVTGHLPSSKINVEKAGIVKFNLGKDG